MMNTINFNHEYCKIPKDENGFLTRNYFLVGISKMNVSKLLKAEGFLFHETRYFDRQSQAFKNFDLKEYLIKTKGECMVLFLWHSLSERVITTIRKYDKVKYDDYMDRIGEEFNLNFVDDEPHFGDGRIGAFRYLNPSSKEYKNRMLRLKS